MSRLGSQSPYVGLVLFRVIAANETKNYKLLSTSLLSRFASYFFLPKLMYSLAIKKKNTTVPEGLEGTVVRVFRGKTWKGIKLTELRVGFKLGSFLRTRTIAVFRQKALRKKKPVVKTTATSLLNEAKIAKIRQVKAGQRRKNINQYNPNFDAQFQLV